MNRLTRDDVEQRLEPLAMDVLTYLLERPGNVVSSDELLRNVWGGRAVLPAAVKKRIGQIRAALGDNVDDPQYLLTIPKRGYCVIAPIKVTETQQGKAESASLSTDNGPPNVANRHRSVAVQPLRNLSNDPDQQYISDGLTEEVIAELAKYGDLHVISRFSAGDNHRPAHQIGDELGVEFVVDGSVTRDGSHFRVTLHLIDARTDRHVWGHTYDIGASTLVNVRDLVARDLGAQLGLDLSRYQTGPTASRKIDDAAFDAYLRAVAAIQSSEEYEAWSAQATGNLQRAVELDPEFADAWALLSLLEVIPAVWVSREHFLAVESHAGTALQLYSRLPAAHTAIGYVRLLRDWDLDGAKAAFRRALAISPNDPRSLHGYMVYLRVDGQTADALRIARKLVSQAPKDLLHRAERAKCLFDARLFEDTIAEAENVRQLDPEFQTLYESQAYFRLGRFEDSFRSRISFYKRAGPDFDKVRQAAFKAWEDSGYEAALRAISEHEPPYPESGLVLVDAQLGDLDKAFSDLEVLADNRSPWLVGIRANPAYDILRLDPRFEALLERIGLPPLTEDAAMLADVGRLMAFRGRAAEGIDRLERAMTESPDDRRLPFWMESMAWAMFATADYVQALEWAGRALDQNISRHAAAVAYLLRAASFAQLGELEAAQSAFSEAHECWPDTLKLDRDLQPFFLGGDHEFRGRFFCGLQQAAS